MRWLDPKQIVCHAYDCVLFERAEYVHTKMHHTIFVSDLRSNHLAGMIKAVIDLPLLPSLLFTYYTLLNGTSSQCGRNPATDVEVYRQNVDSQTLESRILLRLSSHLPSYGSDFQSADFIKLRQIVISGECWCFYFPVHFAGPRARSHLLLP